MKNPNFKYLLHIGFWKMVMGSLLHPKRKGNHLPIVGLADFRRYDADTNGAETHVQPRKWLQKMGDKRSIWKGRALFIFQNKGYSVYSKTSYHKSITTKTKLKEFNFELLVHSPHSLDVALNNYYLFTIVKFILQGKRYAWNGDAIAERYKPYLERLQMCEKHRTDRIYLEGDYNDEYSETFRKIKKIYMFWVAEWANGRD